MAVYCGNHRPRKTEQFLNAVTQGRYEFLHIIGAAIEKPRQVDTRRESTASARQNDSPRPERPKFVECLAERAHQFEVHRLNLSVFYSKHADCAITFDMNHDLSYEALEMRSPLILILTRPSTTLGNSNAAVLTHPDPL